MDAVINHLWQSTLFAGVVALAALALRSNPARTRHWLWLAASVKFLVPFSLLVALGTRVEVPAVSLVLPTLAIQQITTSFAPILMTPASPSHAAYVWWPRAAAVVWILGAIALLLHWSRRWRTIRMALRGATGLPMTAPIPILTSQSSLEPGVFGIFRPVLVLPADIAGKLSAGELDAILAHEYSHVRRRDNRTAALHMFVEALFWFHPLVWWIGSRLVEERERACDEEVLRLGMRPRVYAEGILNVCKHYLESPLTCAAGVAGADLKRRIEEIMTNRVLHDLSLARKLSLAALGVAAIALPLLIGAQSKSQPLTFEVASIRPSDPNARGMRFENTPGGGIRASGVTLKTLIEFAYDVQDFQVSGGPGWLRSDRYDVVAKPEKPDGSDVGPKVTDADQKTLAERLQARTRALLAERFQLAVRTESAERPVYALVEAKNGHKLTPSTEAVGRGIHRNRGLIEGDGTSLAMLAKILSTALGRPVLDRTGLTGKFNYKMEWTEDSVGLGKGADSPAAGPPSEASGTSIFAAIQEQLGLKLESTRGPVEVIVIERAEKPSEN